MRRTGLLLGAAAVVGAFWRLRGLGGQVLLDDEWHALNFVLSRPLATLFFVQGVGANSVPSNLWTRFVYDAFGWSEALLRLPSVAAGLAALIVLPVLVGRLWGTRVAVAFAWLLALSPAVVFYARLCRPYGVVLLCGPLALLALLLWRREGRRVWAVVYVAAGFLAVWHHTLAALPVFAPLLVLAVEAPSRETAIAGAVLLGLCAAALLPANVSNPWFLHIGNSDRVGAKTLLDLSMLVAGTASVPLRAAFVALAAHGALVLRREDRASARALAGAAAAFALYALWTRQEGSHAALQPLRYGIALLPFALVLAAVGLRAAPAPVAAAFVGLLFWTGPLARTYASGSDFAHHSAFQQDYAPIDWSRSRERESYRGLSMRSSDVDACAAAIAGRADVAGVVEYPFLLGDHLDVAYYLQRFHGKPAKAGYRRAGLTFRMPPGGDAAVYGDMTADVVLARVPDVEKGRLRFANLVDLDEPGRLDRSLRGWAVVVRANPVRQAFPDRYRDRGDYPPAAAAARDLRAAFGPPFCAAPSVQAFLIR